MTLKSVSLTRASFKPLLRQSVTCVAMAVFSMVAAAQQASTAKTVNVRAGPDRDYPLVARFGPGTPLSVQGCTEGFEWCDVVAPDGTRGWIYAGNIVYPYQSRAVPVLSYGALIGLPIVTFAIGSYWGDHYRGRPWYGNRWRWENRPPPRPIYHGRPEYRPPPPGYRPPPPGFRPPHEGGRPGDFRPGDGRPGDFRPGGGRPGDFRPGDGRPGEFRPGGRPGNQGPGGSRPPAVRPPLPPQPIPGPRPGAGGGRPVFEGGAGAGAQGPGERPPRGQRPAPQQPPQSAGAQGN